MTSANGRVSGSVQMRPLRLGLIVTPESHESLRRAVEIASICWGGETFLIFEANESPELIQATCIASGVDCVVTFDGDQQNQVLTEMTGFEWWDFGPSPPLVGENFYRLVNLVTLTTAMLRTDHRSMVDKNLVRWDDADNLAPFLRVLFGSVGNATSYERSVAKSIAESYPCLNIEMGAPLPRIGGQFGPLSLGMWQVDHDMPSREIGAVVVNPESTKDLIRFWNLRAIGHLVFPWLVPDSSRVAEFSQRHIDLATPMKWGNDLGRLSAFSENREIPHHLADLLKSRSPEGGFYISSPEMSPYLQFGSRIITDLTANFEVGADQVAGQPPEIRIPLPRTDLIPDEKGTEGWQYAAIEVSIYSEQDIGARVSFRGPGIRRLAPLIRWSVMLGSPMVRGVINGVVIACRVGDDFVTLTAIESVSVIQRLLNDAGYQVTLSDAGRRSARIIDLLGGPTSNLACQPAVREVLDLAAKHSGANLQELHNKAARNKGAWADHFKYGLRGFRYEVWIVRALAAQRIIESVLRYKCPGCGLSQTVVAERVGPTLRCDDCDQETPLSLQIVIGASWRLKTRRLLDQNNLRSTLPIAATLRFFLDLERDSDSLHYALGLELEKEGMKFEIDYAAIVNDDRGPALIVGESKARYSLEDGDIRNLENVQEAVRSIGVECFIALSSSKEELDNAEIQRLRSSTERFLLGIRPMRGREQFINMPLILTKHSLTIPDQDDRHPVKSAGGFYRDIALLSRWTCERELGFDGYDAGKTRALKWKASVGETSEQS